MKPSSRCSLVHAVPTSSSKSVPSPSVFPHIFVWGSCFWLGTPALTPPSASRRLLPHNLFTHNLLTHNLLTHNFLTHNFLTHNLLPHNLLTSTFTLRGRRGTWRHRRAFCLAGVALRALGWLLWRAWFPFGAVGAAAVCIAGVALMALDWLCGRAWAPDCQTVIGVLL